MSPAHKPASASPPGPAEAVLPVESHPDIPVLGPLTGTWSYDLLADRWTWSDEMYVLHGFAPGDVVPTTTLQMAHKHPDDHVKCRQTLAHAVEVGGQFSCYHRIITARQETRYTLLVGNARAAVDGRIVALEGFLVDLTSARHDDYEPAIRDALTQSLASRSAIDMAKGAVMMAYGLDPDAAFAVLRAASNASNIKLKLIAQRLIDELSATDQAPACSNTLKRALERVTNPGYVSVVTD